MKTITLVAHRRPEYLKEVIESLRVNNTRGWSLVAVLDYDVGNAWKSDNWNGQCRALLENIGFMPTAIRFIRGIGGSDEGTYQPLGINKANKCAYDIAFEFGSTINLALEDDTPLAPDCLDMVNWFESRPEQFMNCFDLTAKGADQSARIKTVNTFCPWGWVFKREGYEKLIAPNWMMNPKGWDVTLNELFQRENVPVLQPEVSRMRNIGRVGQHYDEAYYDKVFTNTMWSDGSKRGYQVE